MSEKVVGIYAQVWPLEQRTDIPRSPLALYRTAIHYRANPRSEQVMREIFRQQWPEGEFINVGDNSDWPKKVAEADVIVLTYPDSIGVGYGPTERRLRRARPAYAMLAAINGRRRRFILNWGTLQRLRLRRVLEQTLLVELAFLVAFTFLTPILFVVDRIKGRT